MEEHFLGPNWRKDQREILSKDDIYKFSCYVLIILWKY